MANLTREKRVYFMREFTAEVYRRGCITTDEAVEIAAKVGVDYFSMAQMIWQLKRKGVIMSPKRGVYCRPDHSDGA